MVDDGCTLKYTIKIFYPFKFISPSKTLKQKYICKENHIENAQCIVSILKHYFFSLSFIHNFLMGIEALVLRGLPFFSVTHFILSLFAVTVHLT